MRKTPKGEKHRMKPERRERKRRIKKSKRTPEIVENGIPRTTTDGMTWLDPKGNAPKLDDKGRLQEEFVLTTDLGQKERWGVGTKLPLTPAVNLKWVLEIEEERKQKEKGSGRKSAFDPEPTPATVSGKRRKRTPKSDEDLTEEQKAKRDKRRARREARKKRRAAGSGGAK